MKPRISVITLGVDDLERAYKFYHEGLGLPSKGIIGREWEHGAVAFFDLAGNSKLAVYPRKDLAWDAGVPQGPPSATELSLGYNVRSKEEVETIMSLAISAGATLIKKAHDTFWGGFAGYFADPDGHLWEVVWNPQFLPED